MPDKVTPQIFAAKIKEKYPEYKDVDDLVLAQKMVDKYPEYADKVDFQTGVSGLGSLVTSVESLQPTEILRKQGQNSGLQGESTPVQNGILSESSSGEGLSNNDPVQKFGKGYVDVPDSLAAYYEMNPDLAPASEKKGFFSDIYNSLAAGSSTVGSSFAAIPELLYNLAAIPQNLASDVTGIESLRADYESVSQGVINPLKILSDVDKYYQGLSEAHSNEVTQFEEGIAESILSGNLGDAGSQVINGIAQSVPSMISLVATSGASQAAGLGNITRSSINSIPFAASNFQEIKDNDNIPESLKPIVAGLKGFSEILFEQSFGTAKLIENITSKAIGVDGVKSFVNGYMGRLLKSTGIPQSAFKGSVSEASTQLSQNIIDKYSGVNPDLDLWEGVADAAIIGGVMDAGISTANTVSTKIIDKSNKAKSKELETQIVSLKNDLDSSTPDTANVIQRSIENRTDELNRIIDQNDSETENVPLEVISEVEAIDTEIEQLNSTIEESELSEGSILALQDEVANLESHRDEIVSSEIPAVSVKPQTIGEALSNQEGVITRDGEEGQLIESGQTIEFHVGDTIYELGNINEISDSSLSDLGLEFTAPVPVSIEGNSVTLDGREYVNPNDNFESAINRDEDGRVVSVSLETQDGRKRTFRGSNADAIVREYTLQLEPGVDPITEVQQSLLPTSDSSYIPDVISPLPSISSQEVIEVPEQPITRVNQRESDQVIEQRIREEERTERVLREAPVRARSEFSNQDEYSRYIAENSNDPDQVAREYLNVTPSEPDYIESQIADYLGSGKINESDYARYGDANNLDAGKRKRWVDASNKGVPLDVAAKELSDRLGIEITPAEFIDFIDSYTGLNDFNRSAKSDTQIALENRYKELTGKNLTADAAEKALSRFNDSLTDQDIFDMDTDLQELGLTYNDILNYEEYNRETAGMVQETIPEPKIDKSRSEEIGGESETAQVQPKIKPKTPKTLLNSVSKRLAQTGLANSITLVDTATINENLSTDNGENINGYVDADGNVVINSDKAGLDSPIHELGHIWESKTEQDNPALHARGMDLIKTDEGKTYVDYVRRTQPGLQGDALYKEALAQAIGDNGADLLLKHKNGKIREWLNKVWDWIAGQVGISGKTPQEIANMSLNDFAEAVAIDLLKGRPINNMPNGDIVMKAPSSVNANEQKKIDFLNMMRQKNGIKYQGNVNAQSLSDFELRKFVEFTSISIEDGTIPNKTELTKIANSVGITNSGDIDLVWRLAKGQDSPKGVGIKKSLVSMDRLVEIDYAGLTDAEYIAEGERLVRDEIIDPHSITQDIITNPRALQPWEVTALIYYRSQIQNELEGISDMLDVGLDLLGKGAKKLDSYSYQGLTGKAAATVKLNALKDIIRDFETVMIITANQQSSSFRLRSLMTDKDYNIISFLASSEAGNVYIPEQVRQRMREMASELDDIKAKLNKKAREADALEQKIEEGNISVAASKKEYAPKRVVIRRQAKESFNNALDAIDINSLALSAPNFQANGPIRFQQSATADLSMAVRESIEDMRANVNGNKMSITDAIESAVESINSKVGKGKWNEMAFRSQVVNSMASQGTVLKVKKPYVASNGTLVVPGQYIKSLVNNGVNGLESLISAVKSEVGDSFTDYQVRNAISGYGKVAVRTATDTEIEINTAKRIARLLSKLEDLQQKGRVAKTPKRKFDIDSQSSDLLQQIKALEYNLEMTPEERAQQSETRSNETRRKYLDNYIRDLENRISEKDFAPRDHATKYEKDENTLKLEAEAEKIRNEFKKAKFETELANRSREDKGADLAYEIIFNSTRALTAGADLSAMGVQGAYMLASNPIKSSKVFLDTFKNSFSEADYEQYFAELQTNPYFEIARKAGLSLQLPSFYQSVQEDQYKGNIPTIVWDQTIAKAAGKLAPLFKGNSKKAESKASDINPYKIADRNYSVFLSKIRMDMFTEFINNQIVKQGLDVELDQKAIKETADRVNTLTLSNRIPIHNQALNKGLSATFFSAGKLIATWKIFLDAFPPTGLVRGAIRYNRNPQLAKDYYSNIGRGVGTMMFATIAPALAAYFMYDEDEDDTPPYTYNPHVLNPIHSDFMKIRLGNTRISLFQGVDGNVVFASRFLRGEQMTSSSSELRQLGSYNEPTRRELGVRYLSNKLAPTLSVVDKLFLGTDRDMQEGFDRLKVSWFPMWMSGAYEQYQDTNSVLEAGTLGLLGIIGLSYNNYGGAEFAGSKGTNDRKAKAIIEGSGLSVYNPPEGQREAFDGERKSPVTGARYKDEYIPAYESFMTAATKANEPKLSKDVHWEIKEGQVDKLKQQAYRYAEIKTSGAYMDANFSKLNDKGQSYILLKKDYGKKVDLLKEYMESGKSDVYRRRMSRTITKELNKKGLKAVPEYVDMELDFEVYNEANREANKKLLRMIKTGEITPVLSTDHIKSEDKWLGDNK